MKLQNKVSENNCSRLRMACIEDITEIDLKEQLLVENPEDKEGYLKMKERLLLD